MLVCNVSLRPARAAIPANIAEATTATDATATGSVVFATLVDDPASVADIVDAYLGQIMLEAASADTIVDASIPAIYTATIVETMTAADTQDGAVPSSVPLATFDSSTKTAEVVLSSGNLTATMSVSATNGGVKAAPALATGKYYFEITTIQINGSFAARGLMTSTSTDYIGFGFSGGSGGISIGGGGDIGINGSATGVNIGGLVAAGSLVGIAVDLAAHKVWCRKSGGNWNNDPTANPATGTNGLTYPTATMAPAVCFVGGGGLAGDGYTANFGQTAFAFAAPSGFGNWPA